MSEKGRFYIYVGLIEILNLGNDANLDTKKMAQPVDDGQTMTHKIRPQRTAITESEFLEESLLQTEQSLMDAQAPGSHPFAAQMSNNPASMEI